MTRENQHDSVTTDALILWLLHARGSWITYRTRVDLLGQPEHYPEVQAPRRE